jgi:hypothetical protein
MGAVMEIKIVPKIKATGYPVGEPGYKQAHIAANTAEKETFGARKYNALEKEISRKIPPGELAGSHTKTGIIKVSKKIPKKYHSEIIVHEKTEHRIMSRKHRGRTTRRAKRR